MLRAASAVCGGHDTNQRSDGWHRSVPRPGSRSRQHHHQLPGYLPPPSMNVACVAEVFRRANIQPKHLLQTGFYVLAPKSQIERGRFSKVVKRSSIQKKIERRVQEFGGDKDEWYSMWFQLVIQQMDIQVISWEEIISTIKEHEPDTANSFGDFYRQCVKFNS